MDTEAATQTGAETSERSDVSQPSIEERLAAHLNPPEPEQTETVNRADSNAPEKPGQAEATEDKTEAATEDESQDDALTQAQLSSIAELAEATGLELDKLFDLDIPTKVDGKEGTARLRDLIKSYQLESHLNQKLMAHADEKKAFEAEAQRKVQEYQQRVGQLNQAVTLAQKILDGEFADVNWQELQRTDPSAFQAQYGAYQMRLDGIRQLASVVQQESQQSQAKAETDYKSYLAEQQKLLDSKLPEWSNKATREKDIAEMATVLGESYGITKEELHSLADHRQILIARDATKWRQLQKSKPAIVNKVKDAPKLLKPGTTQSRAAQDALIFKQNRDKLRKSGSTNDAAQALKALGIV